MLTTRFQTGQQRLPTAIQLPWELTQIRTKVKFALPAHVYAWAEEKPGGSPASETPGLGNRRG